MYNFIVVDDEVISRIGISNLLDWNNFGFNLVDSASNGQEALNLLDISNIDLVITDVNMPVLNGIELIKICKERNYKCIFIVLSAFDDFKFVREALKLGAIDYILKLDLCFLQVVNPQFCNKISSVN